jgi:hypothetical protein
MTANLGSYRQEVCSGSRIGGRAFRASAPGVRPARETGMARERPPAIRAISARFQSSSLGEALGKIVYPSPERRLLRFVGSRSHTFPRGAFSVLSPSTSPFSNRSASSRHFWAMASSGRGTWAGALSASLRHFAAELHPWSKTGLPSKPFGFAMRDCAFQCSTFHTVIA